MLSNFGSKLSQQVFRNLKNIKIPFKRNVGSCKPTIPCQIKVGDMLIKILPAFNNNYMYMIVDTASQQAVAIDPAEPEPILNEARREKLCLDYALITHHHEDHQGGNKTMKECLPNLKIIGGDDRICNMDVKVKHFDVLQVGSLRFRALFTPGHTNGHFCYYVESTKCWERVVFVGDVIFSGGIGPLSEGTPKEMYHSLNQLYSLPDDTRKFGGHEFTVRNLQLAAKIEPDNQKVKDRLAWACKQEDDCLPLDLSTIGQEKCFNPFMRVTEKAVQEYCKTEDPICIISKLAEELYKPQDTKY